MYAQKSSIAFIHQGRLASWWRIQSPISGPPSRSDVCHRRVDRLQQRGHEQVELALADREGRAEHDDVLRGPRTARVEECAVREARRNERRGDPILRREGREARAVAHQLDGLE